MRNRWSIIECWHRIRDKPSFTGMPTATGAGRLRSIRALMSAVMHDIKALLAMAMSQPKPKRGRYSETVLAKK